MVGIERLRQICMSLPQATERPSHGEPAWFVQGKKLFCMYAGEHHDNRFAFWCAAPPGEQEFLVASDPERYFRPPYVGPRGWVGVYLDIESPDWDAIESLLEGAYRQVAPEKLVALLDA